MEKYSHQCYLQHYGVKGMKWGVVNTPEVSIGLKALQSMHYNRNRRNRITPQSSEEAVKMGWTRLSESMSAMHQNNKEDGVNNSKWIDKTGKREVVFTGKGSNEHVTTDPRDIGTYNFFNPKKNPIGHAVVDVLPYYLWGNTKDEQTTMPQRINSSIDNVLGRPVTQLDVPICNIGKKWAYSNKIS